MITYENALLLAVRGVGLMICRADCKQLTSFAPQLSHTRVRELLVVGEQVYAGTHRHGFFQLDRQGKVLQNWHRKATRLDQTLPTNGVMTLMHDRQHIWAGLWSGGLHQFDLDSGSKITANQRYAPDTTTLGGRHVRALLTTQNGTRYIGHENGLSVLFPNFNNIGWIGQANDNQSGFSHTSMRTIFPLSDGWLFGSSNGGLYQINEKANSLKRFAPDEPAPNNLVTSAIWDMVEKISEMF